MEKHCYILLNGTPPSKKLLNSLNLSDSLFICADGAFNHLDETFKQKIDILLGDFDSLDIKNAKVPQNVVVKTYPIEKDFTDGYLAVEEAKNQGATSISILGASGGRIDHEYNNYTLLSIASSMGMKAMIESEEFLVYLVFKELSVKTFIGATISVVPFGGKTHILYTNGLKYPATNLVMSKEGSKSVDSVMGISNCAVSESVEIVLDGNALVFIQREGFVNEPNNLY